MAFVGGGVIDWWNYIYYRNYKLWDGSLTKDEIAHSMNKYGYC